MTKKSIASCCSGDKFLYQRPRPISIRLYSKFSFLPSEMKRSYAGFSNVATIYGKRLRYYFTDVMLVVAFQTFLHIGCVEQSDHCSTGFTGIAP